MPTFERYRGLLDWSPWYGTSGPVRWGDVHAQVLLADWLPRRFMGSNEFAAVAPDLLRAFIRFVNKETGVCSESTVETLDTIDPAVVEYLERMYLPRLDYPEPTEPNWSEERELETLAALVGGHEQLDELDTLPLPDETFVWSGIPDDIATQVAEVLVLIDGCCDGLLDVEYRTVCRRVLARVASRGPEVFRRKGRTETAAAAVVWIAGEVNALFDGRPTVRPSHIVQHLGIRSSPSQRGEVMMKAAGFRSYPYDVLRGSADYLVGTRREWVIERCGELRQLIGPADQSTCHTPLRE